MLTSCGFILLYGRIYTFFPAKLVFLSGIFVFEIGSAICAAPQNGGAHHGQSGCRSGKQWGVHRRYLNYDEHCVSCNIHKLATVAKLVGYNNKITVAFRKSIQLHKTHRNY